MDLELSEPGQAFPGPDAEIRLLLLPGLDGTGRLFAPLLGSLPVFVRPHVLAYPSEEPYNYAQLQEYVASELPADRPFALLAESFSGPIAIRIAAKAPPRLVCLVLVATFDWSPLHFLPRLVLGSAARALALLKSIRALRRILAGRDVPPKLLGEIESVARSLDATVLRRRLIDALAVDARAEFRAIKVPILYLGGRRDLIMPRLISSAMKRRQPGMECVLLDAPHMVLQCRPVEAARAIGDFVRRAAECYRG